MEPLGRLRKIFVEKILQGWPPPPESCSRLCAAVLLVLMPATMVLVASDGAAGAHAADPETNPEKSVVAAAEGDPPIGEDDPERR
eukprot:CAMPEP_0118871308 /NCGR_PEP_ID=MMETSP1163-20130328/13947_1 /TAXON_ID=124430 /ORGANISM="Phaeomonas parva, Strain CCMP2877" /LENGTH=84 /DNA_ID=CAMNT_0006806401 /DNA_START=34 /DNA_END=284 /DNA_ORIENTATION=-